MKTAIFSAALTLALAGSTAAFGGEGGTGAIKVGEEFLLLADGPGKGTQDTPAVAFGKDQYLAVWREGWNGEGGNARIYAARVSLDGKVLDDKGFAVAPSKDKDAAQECPRVAFCRDAFLVVWQEFRNGKDNDILAARVALDGKVLDADPIKVAVGPGTQALPDVASDGSGFLVVWQAIPDGDKKNLYRCYAAPVSAEGRVGAAVDTGAQMPQPRVAWDGKNYQLAVCVPGHINAWLLGPDGKPKNKGLEVIGYGGNKFSLSAQPGRGALLLADRVKPDAWGWGGPAAIRCGLVSTEGKLASPWDGQYPKFGPKDNTWLDSSPYEGEKDPSEATRGPWGDTAGAWDGRHSVVVWQRYHVSRRGFVIPLNNSDLLVSRVDQWVPLDQPIPVATTPLEEKWPALASDGAGRLLCVYTRSGGADGKVLVAARTLATEKAAPPPPIKEADKKEGLVLWWKCDEGKGAKLNDASGNGNSGTLARAPGWVAGPSQGKVGGAVELEYDKASSYAITLDGIKNLNAGKGAHTVAAWIKVTHLPTDQFDTQILGLIGSQGRKCSVHGWFVDKTGEVHFGAATPIDCEDASCPKPSVTAKAKLVVGEWKHVAVTYDGTTVTAYLDGQPAGSAQSKFEPLGATQNLALLMRFAQPREKRLACQIGDVRVYSRALGAEEVAALHAAAK